jgi:hypothetical protein
MDLHYNNVLNSLKHRFHLTDISEVIHFLYQLMHNFYNIIVISIIVTIL